MSSPVRVLVVEDQSLVQDLFAEALMDGGYSVAVASSSEPVMATFDAFGASYGALIVDISLPGRFTGWDIARRARELNPRLPVIYITAGDPAEWPSKGVPGSLILPKPIAMARIVAAVSLLIGQSMKPYLH